MLFLWLITDKLTCCTSHHVELILEYAVIEVAQARIGQDQSFLFTSRVPRNQWTGYLFVPTSAAVRGKENLKGVAPMRTFYVRWWRYSNYS